jgi:hypothetical protein
VAVNSQGNFSLTAGRDLSRKRDSRAASVRFNPLNLKGR